MARVSEDPAGLAALYYFLAALYYFFWIGRRQLFLCRRQNLAHVIHPQMRKDGHIKNWDQLLSTKKSLLKGSKRL